ncbi:MAG: DUF5675 family protein [Nitrospirota bacterium]
MKTVILKRISMLRNATFGVLLDCGVTPHMGGIPFAVTVERPWLNNQKSVSCIPAGKYICKRVNSPKFGNTFEVTAVPGRDHILFHKGNLSDDSHGCIIVAEMFDAVGGQDGIAQSAKGFGEFLFRLNGENAFELEIIEV